jgi:hypothetical protein
MRGRVLSGVAITHETGGYPAVVGRMLRRRLDRAGLGSVEAPVTSSRPAALLVADRITTAWLIVLPARGDAVISTGRGFQQRGIINLQRVDARADGHKPAYARPDTADALRMRLGMTAAWRKFPLGR